MTAIAVGDCFEQPFRAFNNRELDLTEGCPFGIVLRVYTHDVVMVFATELGWDPEQDGAVTNVMVHKSPSEHFTVSVCPLLVYTRDKRTLAGQPVGRVHDVSSLIPPRPTRRLLVRSLCCPHVDSNITDQRPCVQVSPVCQRSNFALCLMITTGAQGATSEHLVNIDELGWEQRTKAVIGSLHTYRLFCAYVDPSQPVLGTLDGELVAARLDW
ncbi:hypothetical protein CAOG_004706 [Capsaspora owczarzaki ATCC 30864]|uniref:Uncharacterized protein n=2 Tax=Capsaspora owczarzaki (strain ATCC 30864) TaxID=595528 RepID=A0A0D2WRR8_CAPO3|nr:hypothetical protein CAOG_004706 [Capsaspora owczarzaki ATCC 30864]